MDFRFTTDQQDLIDAAKVFFDGENTVERLRKLSTGEADTALWEQLAELGLIGVMASESHGGLAQPLNVMAGIAEAAGYSGLPEPLVDVAGIAVPLLEQASDSQEMNDLLQEVLAGHTQIGVVPPCAKLKNADTLRHLVIAEKEGIQIVPFSSDQSEQLKSIDPLRNLSKVGETQSEVHPLAQWHGGVLSAAQLLGLSHRMVDMSVEYVKERQQFGKPIGSFQAIKHHLASVYTQIEFTRPAIHLAAMQNGRAVHTAKIAAIDTAMFAAETAIQVHGGMGYTFEADLHLFMKRSWALCGEWGDRSFHMRELENLVLNGSDPIGAGATFQGVENG